MNAANERRPKYTERWTAHLVYDGDEWGKSFTRTVTISFDDHDEVEEAIRNTCADLDNPDVWLKGCERFDSWVNR